MAHSHSAQPASGIVKDGSDYLFEWLGRQVMASTFCATIICLNQLYTTQLRTGREGSSGGPLLA